LSGDYSVQLVTGCLPPAAIVKKMQQKVNAMKVTTDAAVPEPPLRPRAPGTDLSARDSALMEQARALEASFLSEMLSYTGLGAAQEEFGGGIGEEQFSSFLRQEQANLMVARGGIGLAEQLFNAMTRNDHASG
jgi:peptidoglycan hydrolase FlgJ